jgi:cytoskeletal protein CcmA (bactofilin family)
MFGIRAKIDTLLGQNAEIKGNVSVDGAVVIDGRLEGDVTATDRITIGTHGQVRGNLNAPEVVVGGTVFGDISAPERAELLAGAQVAGDIRSPRLSVADGARVSGRMDMATPAPAPDAAPELHLAQS